MCQLMGMCFARPISADFSIREFAERGEDNPDGWGLAWYPDRSVAVIKEPEKWRASQYWGFLETYRGLNSHLYLAHVRLKTVGTARTHADTHPFVRELAGREYCFAHNGTLEGPFWKLPLDRYRPVGKTDSEYLFCHLLDFISQWPNGLADEQAWQKLAQRLREINRFGRLNCLLSDGERLLCYHDRAGWKGLTYRRVSIRDEQNRHFEDATIQVELAGQPLNYGVVVATAPLSASGWQSLRPEECLVLEKGTVVSALGPSIDGQPPGALKAIAPSHLDSSQSPVGKEMA